MEVEFKKPKLDGQISSLRIEQSVIDGLAKIAEHENIPVRDVVRSILRAYVKEYLSKANQGEKNEER